MRFSWTYRMRLRFSREFMELDRWFSGLEWLLATDQEKARMIVLHRKYVIILNYLLERELRNIKKK